MIRAKLEEYLGKKVQLTIGEDHLTGWLHETSEYPQNPNMYWKRNYYFVSEEPDSDIPILYIFRCSHVKKCVLLQDRR